QFLPKVKQLGKPAVQPEKLVKWDLDPNTGTLSLDIAFEALAVLPDNLHMVRTACPSATIISCEPITLPKLYPRLLPGPVKFSDFGDGSYRLEGERLRSIDKMRLESNGEAILVDPSVGYNDVNFSLPDSEIKKAS